MPATSVGESGNSTTGRRSLRARLGAIDRAFPVPAAVSAAARAWSCLERLVNHLTDATPAFVTRFLAAIVETRIDFFVVS